MREPLHPWAQFALSLLTPPGTSLPLRIKTLRHLLLFINLLLPSGGLLGMYVGALPGPAPVKSVGVDPPALWIVVALMLALLAIPLSLEPPTAFVDAFPELGFALTYVISGMNPLYRSG